MYCSGLCTSPYTLHTVSIVNTVYFTIRVKVGRLRLHLAIADRTNEKFKNNKYISKKERHIVKVNIIHHSAF